MKIGLTLDISAKKDGRGAGLRGSPKSHPSAARAGEGAGHDLRVPHESQADFVAGVEQQREYALRQ